MTAMDEQGKRISYIGQAWLVILLALCFGAALALVHTTLGPRIAENKRNETYSVIPVLVPGADRDMTEELIVQSRSGSDVRVYKAFTTDGKHKGWVIPAQGQGFADRIELLIGQDVDLTTITGMYVLAQKETPGLGDYIKGEDFRDRFRGKPTDRPLVVVKTDPREENEIQALTGATISSESVTDTINSAIDNLREVLLAHNSSGAGARK
ncbi:MAG: FMN-binding protein [Candidatus Krumholzibacteria bacterium]|nr:FMN-binding protein [Candidatus Krumholzibacteria bacterium]